MTTAAPPDTSLMRDTLLILRERAAKAGRRNDVDLIDAGLAGDADAALLARVGPVSLTPRQLEVLRAIAELTANGIAPTFDELAEFVGIKKCSIWEHVESLIRKGVVATDKHRARSIRIIDRAANQSPTRS